MAIVHKLYDGTNTIDLTTTTGFQSMVDYVPQVADIPGDGSIPPYIEELIPVTVKGTSDDNFAAELQTFHLLQREAAQYRVDPQATTPVYYHQKLDGETGERRALVKSLSLQFANEAGDWFAEYPANTDGKKARLVVERHPYWEPTTARTFPTFSVPRALYFSYDYTAAGGGGTPGAHDIVGDVGARIEDLIFVNEAADGDAARFWCGFRSASKHGTLANFVQVWELEDGTNTDGEVADAVDATASGGNNVTLTPAGGGTDWDDGDFHDVLRIDLNDVSVNESDQYGLFLWLLRAQATDDDVWEVQLRWGFSGTNEADLVQGNVVQVTDINAWEIYETDVMPIPLRNVHEIPTGVRSDSYDANYAIYLYARRTTASGGTLELDCLLPVPVDEGYVYIDSFESTAAGSNVFTSVHTSPEDTQYAIASTNIVFFGLPAVSAHGFYLPVGDGRLYVVVAQEDGSDLTEGLGYMSYNGSADAGSYYERWASLRGAE
jgi:hypothetical protein